MLIGYDASRANLTAKTGTEWYSYYLINGLKKIDKNNNYLLYTPDKLSIDFLPLPPNFKEKILKWPGKRFWTTGRLSYEMLVNKPDILFITGHTFPFIAGKVNIITWHDLAYEHYPGYYNKKQLLSLKSGVRRMKKMADKIITVSNFTKNELINIYRIKPEKIEVIYLGIDKNKYNYLDIELSPLTKYGIDDKYIIYIGRLEEKKNLINLIKGFNIFKKNYYKNYQLILIGKEGFGTAKIINEINKSPYNKDIKIIGWLPEEEKINLLAQADIFVYPSYYEGFGLPLLEAMSLKIPIVASDLAVFKEIADNAVLYFNPNNPEELAEKIAKIIESGKLKSDLIERGLKRIQNFDWQKTSEQTLKILNNVNSNPKLNYFTLT